MGQLSQRTDGADANDWTELEQGFFAAAPPEVAVEPPPPASFDDLLPIEPRARRRTAKARKGGGAPKQRRQVASALAALRGTALPLARRAGRWVGARGRVGARGVVSASRRAAASLRRVPGLRATRERLERGLRPLLTRIASDLPKRPDGKTIAAAIAALLVVSGLSARVLGSRSYAQSPAAVTATRVEPPPAAPALAPEVPQPEPAAQAPAPKAPEVHHVAQRHRTKRHAARATIAPLHAHVVTRAR